MAGTKAGGIKAAAKNKAKDPNFYAKIGAKGGRNGHTGGFAANPQLARVAGAKGGRISRRRKAEDKQQRIFKKALYIRGVFLNISEVDSQLPD